jgi:hypothetical protein
MERTMEVAEARERLEEYERQERKLRRRFISPTMLFFAAFAFAFLVTGGFGSWPGNLLLGTVFAAWILYSPRLTGVYWTAAQNRKLNVVLLAGFCWILLCNAYFVNWNPNGIPLSGLVGGILAAAPFLVLARGYRA